MHITIDKAGAGDVLIHPAYAGEALSYPLGEGRKRPGMMTWLYGRSEGEADVLAAAVGERRQETPERVRRAAGAAGRALLAEGRSSGTLVRDPLAAGAENAGENAGAAAQWLQAWIEGWLLGLYRFDKYKSATKITGDVRLNLRSEDWAELSLAQLEQIIGTALHRAAGTNLTRDWVNETPDTLNPDTFVAWTQELFQDRPVHVRIYRGQELIDRGMNGLLTVGAGSKHQPALIELRYEGGGSDADANANMPMLALVGKAITFDMGGMNAKTGRDISDARMDMGGAAAVVGAMDILVRQRAEVRVTALIAVADNLPDARATLPSSVIKYPNGLTVQVANTDGEGRLVLADALLHAAKLGAAQAIDIATLTGNVGDALGLAIAGIWGDADMTRSLVEIGERNGERLWPMPLIDEYESELKSPYADLRNVGTSTLAGASVAALFIRRFVADTMDWVHIDMAGTVQYKQDAGYAEVGATGYGARLLADYAADYARKHRA
ncbi:leucyl aminopeptidase [Paenibacillus sp. UNCCL117]|uniref:M17 family metallopeptidase n=1 Tax=unclassified Paenibacillus TaxID=185978 RepID=UPI00088F0D16|nr:MULTISPECIES: leucyl aminopeptidase family protein [unclassified Paenibacillus]SDC28675.1 leucyl aminopeptidase [Paenibacillus sp. cl123]SFW20617.1 leucyl aminopeptidase [Paenibacillus sp. UNCCL117]